MPAQQSVRLNVDGAGDPEDYWNDVALCNQVRINGAAILQPLKWNETKAIVHLIGGTTGSEDLPTGLIQKMDLNSDRTLQWVTSGNLKIPRKNANCVNLPDGKVLITGGNQYGERETFVSIPEMYDPETGETEMMAAMSYPRWYHSTAIILPDATVLASGGDNQAGYPNTNTFEVYNPGYLHDGDRPVITYIETQDLSYGQEFNINVSHQITEAIIIKLGFPTHGFDQSQRAIYLNCEEQVVEGLYKLTAPANGSIAPPGFYMLFVLRPITASTSGTNKIPSVAKFIKLIIN
ncbi:MAG TPA: galactose oxidase-like domain-containing protein [Ignavibacteria bacterium]|nr:galactose oxidase-like domain-containing protein [Ignavibacteria bacterium]